MCYDVSRKENDGCTMEKQTGVRTGSHKHETNFYLLAPTETLWSKFKGLCEFYITSH